MRTRHRRSRLLPLLVLGGVGLAATLSLAVAPTARGETDAARGRAALEQSAAAYAAAPALVDVARLEIKMGGQPPQKVEIEFGFGRKTDGYVKLPGLNATALDGRLYMTRDDVPDKYLEVALEGDLAATMDSILGTESNLPRFGIVARPCQTDLVGTTRCQGQFERSPPAVVLPHGHRGFRGFGAQDQLGVG